MNFPTTTADATTSSFGLYEALGAVPKYAGKSKYDYLLELDSEAMVRELRPDFFKLKNFPVRDIMVTSAAASDEYDFVSRFFEPGARVNEDPVTGSGHCCLGPYWSQRIGKSELTAYQASARGGVICVRVAEERVYLGGKAVSVLKGSCSG